MENKIKTIRQLQLIAAKLKKQGKKIITTNGVFDILHVGHLDSFMRSKKYGDILIVGVNSDKSVKMLNKGKGRPYNKATDRAKLVAGIEVVDYIYIFNEKRPVETLARIKPHIHVKTDEYKNFCPEKKIIEKFGGKVKFIKPIKGYSSTKIIKNIIKSK